MPLSRAYRPRARDIAKIPIVTAIHPASVHCVLWRSVASRLVPGVEALLNKPILGPLIRPLPAHLQTPRMELQSASPTLTAKFLKSITMLL